MKGASLVRRLWSSAKPSSFSEVRRAGDVKAEICSSDAGVAPLCHFRSLPAAASSRGFCALAAAPVSDPKESSASEEVQKIHDELMKIMKGECLPPTALMRSLLEKCSSPADIKLALEAVGGLRTVRAAKGQIQANFKNNLTHKVMKACLQAKDPRSALKTLWAHNVYGFTPSLETAHQILLYARDQGDVSLMRETLSTMIRNSLSPTPSTAAITLRLCKDQGDENLLFSLASEFQRNGVKLKPDLYDICIATAANAGQVDHVMEIQKWRSELNLPSTMASSFALSKAHLLNGQPKDAAQLIHAAEESKERDMYLRVLVRAWPAEVSKLQKRFKAANLKKNIGALLEELKALGCRVAVDVAQEFGAEAQALRKVVYV